MAFSNPSESINTMSQPIYTPNLDPAEHVLDMPLYKPTERCYELIEDGIALYDHEMANGSVTRAWRMQARNICQPGEDPVNLFTLHTTVRRNQRCIQCAEATSNSLARCVMPNKDQACENCVAHRDPAECVRKFKLLRENGANLITDQVCKESERHLVVALGQIKVDIMNRAPFDLEVDTWRRIEIAGGNPSGCSRARVFVDTVSLVTWKRKHNPTFDLGKLNYTLKGEYRTVWSSMYYGTRAVPDPSETSVIRSRPPLVWVNGVSGSNKECNSLKFSVPRLGIDIEKAKELQDLEKYHIVVIGDRETEDKNHHAAIRIMEHILLEMTGLVGSAQSLRNVAEELRRAFVSIDDQERLGAMVTRGQYGPYNSGFIWRRPFPSRSTKTTNMAVATAVLKDLRTDDTVKLSTVMTFNTYIQDRACLAYIQQQSLDSIARGDGILKIILSAYLAAQRLELGLLSREDVLEQYCSCTTPETRAATEHLCMVCYLTRPCARMQMCATSDGRFMILCNGCSTRETSNNLSYGVMDAEFFIKHKSKVFFTEDSKFYEVPWTSEELAGVLIKNCLSVTDKTLWKDAYCSDPVTLADARYPKDANIDAGLAGFHPYRMSLEKPFRRFLRLDGVITLHDLDNVALTKDCVNRLKSNRAGSVLPLFKLALQLKKDVETDPPCISYHDKVSAKWRIFERASDNQRVIDQCAPYTSKTRIRNIPTRAEYLRVQGMQMSGVWDSRCQPSSTKKRTLFMSRGQLQKTKLATTWDNEEWAQILKVVSQIETDRSPTGFNKHHLPMLPRRGDNGIPWLWRADTCPEDVDKGYIFNEFSARLRTWTDHCNRKHATDESPATLFIEYVVQWYATGGKCHMFGFTLTPFCGHMANYSFGRGIEQELAGGQTQRIKPGAQMKTGCTTHLPEDIFKDYDITRRTVIIESWAANSMRWCYPNTTYLIPLLERAILDIPDNTPWYQGVKTLDDYADIPLPDSCKDLTEWRRAFSNGDAATQTDGAVLDNVEEDDDYEIATWEEHEKQIAAIYSEGPSLTNMADEEAPLPKEARLDNTRG